MRRIRPFPIGLWVLLWALPAAAHGPHDIVEALAVSPAYASDRTVFVAEPRLDLLRSRDGGLSWKQLDRGLDNIHPILSIAISPGFRSDQTVLISTAGDGIYRSTDGGDSWTRAGRGLVDGRVVILAVSPGQGASGWMMLAADSGGRCYLSENRGEAWRPVMTHGAWITAAAFARNGHAIVLGDAKGGVWVSGDRGTSWKGLQRMPEQGGITSLVAIEGAHAGIRILAGTEKGGIIALGGRGGEPPREMNAGLTDRHIRSLALSPGFERDSTVFASTWHDGFFKSVDAGATWRRYDQGLTKSPQADSELYRSPHFRTVCPGNGFPKDKTLFIAGFNGLFKSTDGGRSWKELDTQPPSLVTALAVSPGAPTPNPPAIAALSAHGGVFLSEDGGEHWAARNKGLTALASAINLAFSPDYAVDDTLLLIGEGCMGVSRNRGESWTVQKLVKNNGFYHLCARYLLQRLGRQIPATLRQERLNADHIAFSPDFHSDPAVFLGTRRRGLYRTRNLGQDLSCLMKNAPISSLALSPDFPEDETLFAGFRGAGVYQSTDGGKHWHPVLMLWKTPPQNAAGFSLYSRVDIDRHEIHVALSPGYARDSIVFAGSVHGLFRSADKGGSWENVPVRETGPHAWVRAMAVSPEFKEDRLVLVSLKGRGLFVSRDGGRSFTPTGRGLLWSNHTLKKILFSPNYSRDRRIYAASEEEVFLSMDEGRTWTIKKRPVRYENTRAEVIDFTGKWEIVPQPGAGGGDISVAARAGSAAVLAFSGSQVSWIGSAGPDQGRAEVFIDGVSAGEIDQYRPARETGVVFFRADKLAAGPHIIRIIATGEADPRATAARVAIDALEIYR